MSKQQRRRPQARKPRQTKVDRRSSGGPRPPKYNRNKDQSDE